VIPAWPLVTGAVPAVAVGAGGVALAGLVWGRGRGWWTRRLPLVVVAVAVAVAAGTAATVVDRVWRPFPEGLPTATSWWVGVPTLALALAVIRPPTRIPGNRSKPTGRSVRARVSGPAAASAAVLVVVLATAVQVNAYFGAYPTLASALGASPPNQVAFIDVTGPPGRAVPMVGATGGRALAQVWHPPPGMPAGGVISEVAIPAPTSGFAARPGWVYLPPAYLATPRAQLPVLVLVSGQPGTSRDWLDGGKLSEVMDRFARAHDGLAPVVVMPDTLGRSLANPLCLDSRLGRAETYLAVDVPRWIRTRLLVDADPRAWTVAGFSQGGTCALQMAVRAPEVYPTFVDISGQQAPTLGDPARTAAAAFGGDPTALARVDPLTVLGHTRYPRTAAVIVAGREDTTYRPQQQRVLAAVRAAGMDARWVELPGGHTWRVWGPGLEQSLPWLADRVGLTGPAPSPPSIPTGRPPGPTGPAR